MNQEARLDKWLWSARIYKTRSIAINACKNGRVMMNGVRMKPAHLVKVGDIIEVRKSPITFSFRIKQTIEHRVGAKLVPEIFENVTTPEQYKLLEMNKIRNFIDRSKGMGRPTKKERRDLDDFSISSYSEESNFDEETDFDFDINELKPL